MKRSELCILNIPTGEEKKGVILVRPNFFSENFFLDNLTSEPSYYAKIENGEREHVSTPIVIDGDTGHEIIECPYVIGSICGLLHTDCLYEKKLQ